MTADLFYDYRTQVGIALVVRIFARAVGKGPAAARLALDAAFFTALTALLLFHDMTPYEAGPSIGTSMDRVTAGMAKSLWWIAGCMLLVSLIRLFLIFERTPREGRLLQDVLIGVVVVGTAFSIVSYVLGIPVGTLIATSGAFAIVLGLALQNTLADVFSGVALNLGKPYRIGDWIVLDDVIQGRVVETNWRATHLLSRTNDLVIVPNSALARARLVNQSSPDETHGISLVLRMKLTHAPAVIEDVMRTVLSSSNHILKQPEPAVQIVSVDSFSIEVELVCRVKDISRSRAARNELFDLAYRHARAAGLMLAVPLGAPPEAYLQDEANLPSASRRLIGAVAHFAMLAEAEKDDLATALVKQVFEKGAVIVAQGDVCDGLCIVHSGVVLVERDIGTSVVEMTRLSPHDCFGERGPLSGSPETATKRALTPVVIYTVPTDRIRSAIKSHRIMADELSLLSSRHAAYGDHVIAERMKTKLQSSYSFADRIRHLFDMSEDA